MIEIMYDPSNVGSQICNSKGKITICRKYHMTKEEMKINKKIWDRDIKDVPKFIVKKAGKYFFNPYRKGIYYYQIKSLFLLGSNEWHSLDVILNKIEEIMSSIKIIDNNVITNVWNKFKGKISQTNAYKTKDYIGRIQENMVFFQRLTKSHPYGYKLRQVYSAVDIKRISVEGFSQGKYYYRLSTYNNAMESLPIRDFSEFVFKQHKNRYINPRFIGTIKTKDITMKQGVKI
jgi:hypothetical protein